jgi:tRNA(His) 5'-end guanylyltransferase
MGKDTSSFGDRMKAYEDVSRIYLTRRLPLIIRVDGKAFHSFTRRFDKPYSTPFRDAMLRTAQTLCEETQGCKLAYWQSDEISLLLTDYDKLTTDAWFDKNLQKVVSVSASIATAEFNAHFSWWPTRMIYRIEKPAHFDSRAFVLPKEEVCNYFLWRQRDASRNSINAIGQAYFPDARLHGLNTDQVQELLFKEKSINWNNLETWKKRGACLIYTDRGWKIDMEIPLFSQDRDYINRFVNVEEE